MFQGQKPDLQGWKHRTFPVPAWNPNFLPFDAIELPATTDTPPPHPAPIVDGGPTISPGKIILPDTITASRLFARRAEIDPLKFKAYGIIVFRTSSDGNADKVERRMRVCRAFHAVLPTTDEVGASNQDQMVTVWPINDVDDETIARIKNPFTDRDDSCTLAVANYSRVLGRQAASMASKAGTSTKGRGPHLFAWAPPKNIGSDKAAILSMDLSSAETEKEMENMLLDWAAKIEGDPEFWNEGWNLESFRLKAKYFFDRYGADVVALISGDGKG